jgi:hypothetical protein
LKEAKALLDAIFGLGRCRSNPEFRLPRQMAYRPEPRLKWHFVIARPYTGGLQSPKMEAQRRARGDVEPPAGRGTGAQVIVDATTLIAAWNKQTLRELCAIWGDGDRVSVLSLA